jgi:HlyD family secretion protein
MKRIVIAVIVVAAGVGVLAIIYSLSRNKGKTSEEAKALLTAKVGRGDIRSTVASTGSVIASFDVDIKCKASGTIIKLPYDVSSNVKAGDLLVQLDPIDEKRNVEQAKASLEASKARLATAKTNLDLAKAALDTDRKRAEATLMSAKARAEDAKAKAARQKGLFDKRLASQEDYDTAATNAVQCVAELECAQVRMEELKTQKLALNLKKQEVTLAETQVTSDKISLDIAEQRLSDTTVLSPIDGVVVARNVQEGQIISSGISNVGGGTTIMSISDLSSIFVLAAVDESDIGKVALGQKVDITADAYPQRTFEGEVVRIATRGVSSSAVVTFEVKIGVKGKDASLLKPQMTANIEVEADKADDTLLIPTEAVTRGNKGTTVNVVRSDGVEEQRPVELGMSDGLKYQVKSGLEEGETVALRKLGDSPWRSQQDQKKKPGMMGGPPPGPPPP